MLMYVYTRCSPIPGRINACLCMYVLENRHTEGWTNKHTYLLTDRSKDFQVYQYIYLLSDFSTHLIVSLSCVR